ncbi:MAG: hypothetical protein V1794_16185 [Candidatus Glassbacteria bacterium]
MRVPESPRSCFSMPYLLLLILLLLLIVPAPPLRAAAPAGKVIIFNNASHDLQDFIPHAELAARMKPYGEVQIDISSLADKSWYEIPPGGSPWHEYACYVPAPWKFYPHPKIAPFIPADWVAANRKLLLEKAAVIRKLGLGALMESKDTHFLPEAFFQACPALRGPRVDHPRRSRKEAFSLCVDLPETREMIEWMSGELRRSVPGLKSLVTGANDAGAGLCWAAALYPGPNGPQYCRYLTAGERVRDLSLAVHRGAEKGGGPVTLFWENVNFWQNELEVVRPLLPENTYLARTDPSIMSVGSLRNEAYPFLGLFDPLDVIADMERFHDPRVKYLFISCVPWYDRCQESPETVAKFLDLVGDCINEPTGNLSERLARLRKFAGRWAGEANAEKVFQAFYDLNRAFEMKSLATPGYAGYSNVYCGVSDRHLTRPLVIKPDLLTPAQEAYFLPYVFNPFENEARMDYIDFHGSRMQGTTSWDDRGLRRALSLAVRAGRTLENLDGAPEGPWLGKVGLALRMWASEVRSIHNFYHAQLIRDQYADRLAGAPRVPPKVESWDGEPGNFQWNEIMRDELDNTNELIAMLEAGGLELVGRAKDKKHEDTFLIGPDLVDQLRQKVKIMREHWLDVQGYIATPHK